MQESQTQREQRKNMYISFVLAHATGTEDYNALIEEAVEKWESSNEYREIQ